MKKFIFLFLVLGLSGLSACNSKGIAKNSDTETIPTGNKITKKDLPQLNISDPSEDVVLISTSMGDIKIILFPEIAPKAVENFLGHIENNYYNNTNFHRVVENFVIQGGDPSGDGTGGTSVWGTEFSPEISNRLYHLNGALAMARTPGNTDLETQGSQFYIVSNTHDQTSTIKGHKLLKESIPELLTEKEYPKEILDEYKKGGTPSLDMQYTVFGQVVDGLDVIQLISMVKTEEEKPMEDIVINSISQ